MRGINLAQRLNIVEEKFLNTIKKYNLISTNDVIVVGVSGGPDSITLLTCLDKYKDKFQYKSVVAHVNHLIREDSTDDEQFVEKLCEKLNIPCEVKRANVAEIAKEGIKSKKKGFPLLFSSFFVPLHPKRLIKWNRNRSTRRCVAM